MTALELKHKLQALDNKIVRLLMKSKYRGLSSNNIKTNIVTEGGAATVLTSINNYDQAVLSQLVVSSSAHINDRVLKAYSKAKKKIEAQMRRQLHNARNLKAKLKNGR